MPAINQRGRPCKETVRAWLRTRREANAPPPSIEQIRRELGWGRPPAADATVRQNDARTRRLPGY